MRDPKKGEIPFTKRRTGNGDRFREVLPVAHNDVPTARATVRMHRKSSIKLDFLRAEPLTRAGLSH